MFLNRNTGIREYRPAIVAYTTPSSHQHGRLFTAPASRPLMELSKWTASERSIEDEYCTGCGAVEAFRKI